MRTGAATLCAVALVGGCYEGATSSPGGLDPATDPGSGTTGDSGDGDDADETGEPGSAPSCEGEGAVAAAPLRRLSRWELDNTLRDLLRDDTRPAAMHLPGDLVDRGFDNLATAQNVSLLVVDAYMRLAEDVAARVDIDALVPCESTDDACARTFVEVFGARAYRRPLSDEDADALLGVFDGGSSFEEGARMVVEAVLQSPSFLYRPELGVAATQTDGLVALSDHELATRLSYFLWGSMPDDALLDAAATGELSDPDALVLQAGRMLADPRARQMMAHFAWQWLGLPDLALAAKDPAVYPEFDADLAAAMEAETLAFVEHVVFDAEGDLTTLMTADYTLADASIAALYGVDDGRGDAFEPLALPADRRAGMLTHPSVLTVNAQVDRSSPALRGRFVLSQLLCSVPELLEVPPNVDNTLPVDPDATTREQMEQHASLPECKVCHLQLDPIGFAFEHYDGLGRWRDDENGMPIDATGELLGLPDSSFDGAPQLAARLAREPEVHRCFADRTFTFALARPPDEDDEACTIDQVRAAFEDSGGDVEALLLAIVASDAFRYRPVAD